MSGFVSWVDFQERFATEGSGRARLQVLKDASGVSLCGFVKDTTEAGVIVHSDGWQSYRLTGLSAPTTYSQITNTPNLTKPNTNERNYE